MDNQEKRRQIIEIRANSNLTEKEKNSQILNVMMSNNKCNPDDFFDRNDNLSKTCGHVVKSCYKMFYSCCNIYDPCLTCHKVRGFCKKKSIATKITCSKCDVEQEPSTQCISCHIEFAKNYCGICQIWNNNEMSHCDKCNSCKPHKKEDLYHCDKCQTCYIKKNLHLHKCINYKESNCVVCNKSVYNSASIVKNLDCKHTIHKECYNEMYSRENYKCPLCKKSMWDMKSTWENIRTNIKFTPLPKDIVPINPNDIVNSPYGKFKVIEKKVIDNEIFWKGEYINLNTNQDESSNITDLISENLLEKDNTRNIYCNDCNTNSITPYHFYGLECGCCGSFNTQH